MKRFLLIFLLFFNFSYSAYYNEQGTPISWNEFHLKMNYCYSAVLERNRFYKSGTYNEEYGDYDFNGLPLQPLELTAKSGNFALGVSEIVIECTMTPAGYSSIGDEDAIYENTKFGSAEKPTGYKRSPLDKCNNHDYFRYGDTYLIQCDPVTGVWSYVENSVASSFNFRSWNYDCKIPKSKLGVGWCRIGGNLQPLVEMSSSQCYAQKGQYYSPNRKYSGSSYTHIFIGKVNVGLTITDAGFLYGTFACVLGDNETNKYSQSINTIAPVRTCTGDNCYNNQIKFDPNNIEEYKNAVGGTGGGTGGTGGGLTLAEIEPKFAEIITDLQTVKNNNSTTSSQLLGKVSDVESSLLLTNENIAISKEVLETKLNQAIQNQDLISQKITDSEETLKLEFHGVATQSKDEIIDHQTDLNNELKSELEANKQLISDLENQISNYEAGNIEARNNILGGLVGLENQLNGLNSKLDGLASGGGTGGTGGNDDVLAGLGNIDNTLKDGLFDDNQNPYLKNIDDSLKKGQETPEDTGAINSLVGGELGFSSNKYNNVLNVGFCSRPNNITMNLMGQTFTLIDFSYIDPYVSYIRGLLLTISGLLGFFIFLRGAR